MGKMAMLPAPSEVRVFGHGKSRQVRALFRERCSPAEIAIALGVSVSFVSQQVRWKAGNRPLAARTWQ